jgi:hypothetical protein
VRDALQSLPWVESDPATIHTDIKVQQVRFRVRDRAAFDLPALQAALAEKGFAKAALLAGPTDS